MHTTTQPIEDLDASIEQVERLLTTLTGQSAPPPADPPYAPIPPEVEKTRYVEEQLERLLGLMGPPAPGRPPFTPPVAAWLSSQEAIVVVELPGVPRDAVQLTVTGQALEVQGVRPARRSGASASARAPWSELVSGPFYRRIPLPPQANADGLQAEMHDGLLEVRIPLQAPSAARAVPIA